jgi:hypothetical protein
MLANQKIARIKFFNPGWWYSIRDISQISELTGEIFLLRYAVVSQFVNNPERQGVIYSLFSSENVIGFDEIYNMLQEISPAYFTKLYLQNWEGEKRPNVKRYMQFFYGSFLFKDGETKESTTVLEDIVYNTLLDTAHEKLFLGRLYQQLAINYTAGGRTSEADKMKYYLFSEYPQLIPFSEVKIKMKLNVTGQNDEAVRDVLSDLRECNINWTDTPDNTTLNAILNFMKNKNGNEVYYSVVDQTGNVLVPQQRLIFKNVKNVGKELALRLFGVSGPLQIENN